MRKLITATFIMIFSVLAFHNSQAQFVKAGVGLMYGTEIEQPGLRIDGVYKINEEIRAVADLGFYLPDERESSGGGVTSTTTSTYWELNLNGNYIFTTDSESGMTAYGLAGLNYLNFSVDSEASGGGFSGSSSYSDSEIGLNVGAGIEYALDFGDLFGELKYVIGDFDQLNIGAGLRFNF